MMLEPEPELTPNPHCITSLGCYSQRQVGTAVCPLACLRLGLAAGLRGVRAHRETLPVRKCAVAS